MFLVPGSQADVNVVTFRRFSSASCSTLQGFPSGLTLRFRCRPFAWRAAGRSACATCWWSTHTAVRTQTRPCCWAWTSCRKQTGRGPLPRPVRARLPIDPFRRISPIDAFCLFGLIQRDIVCVCLPLSPTVRRAPWGWCCRCGATRRSAWRGRGTWHPADWRDPSLRQRINFLNKTNESRRAIACYFEQKRLLFFFSELKVLYNKIPFGRGRANIS